MTKKEWLARCEMVYELGYTDVLRIAFDYAEATQRYKGGQLDIFDEILKRDTKRSPETLANDTDAYNALQAMAILTKECQKCATNPDAWHLRGCMFGCEIKNEYSCAKCGKHCKRVAKNGIVVTLRDCKCV